MTDVWRLNEDRSWDGPPKKPGKPDRHVEQQYSDALEDQLAEIYIALQRKDSILVLFEDMFDIAEKFQAVNEWFSARGIGLDHRYQTGCKMATGGWLYYCPADVHVVPTRGVSMEVDLRPYADELVRKSGLEARLRRKAEQS